MARSRKSSEPDKDTEEAGGSAKDAVEDAEIVGETSPPSDENGEKDATEMAADTDGKVADTADHAPAEPEPPVEPTAAEASEELRALERGGSNVRSEPQTGGSGRVVALVFGGVLAGLIGFAAARQFENDGREAELAAALSTLRTEVSDQGAGLAEIRASLETLRAEVAAAASSAVDLSAMETRLSEAEARSEGLASALANLEGRADGFDGRLDELALRPMPEAFDSASLDAEIAQFRAELSSVVEEARERVLAAEAEAARLAAEAAEAAAAREAEAAAAAAAREAEALAAAEAARREAALIRILAALESGDDYEAEVKELSGIDVPEALAAPAPEGVATLATLQQSFPDAARAALDASIRTAVDGSTTDRVIAFLRVQTGARSLEPREGDDPDAVLSRAEAALSDGDLAAALAELDALPDAGAAEMADWRAAAEGRLNAVSAATTLAETLGAN